MSREKQYICRNASPSRNFTPLCNTLLQDFELSLEAKGLQVHILSFKGEWVFNKTWAREKFKIGEQKLERILRELVERKYVLAEQTHNGNGRFGSTLYYFTDVPGTFSTDDRTVKTAPTVDDRTAENRAAVNRAAVNAPHIKDLKEKRLKGEKDIAQQAAPDTSVKSTATPKKRKPATKGETDFEAAWNKYKALSQRSAGSKPGALALYLRLSEERKTLVIPAIAAYAKDCAGEKIGRDDHRSMADMERFFKKFFDQHADALAEVASPDPEREQELQVKFLAHDLRNGELKYAAKWWKGLNEVPSRIMQAARELMASQDAIAQAA